MKGEGSGVVHWRMLMHSDAYHCIYNGYLFISGEGQKGKGNRKLILWSSGRVRVTINSKFLKFLNIPIYLYISVQICTSSDRFVHICTDLYKFLQTSLIGPNSYPTKKYSGAGPEG